MAMLERSLRARVIPRGARNFRSYAELAEAYEERRWSSNGTANRVLRMPRGRRRWSRPGTHPSCSRRGRRLPRSPAGSTVVLKPPEWAPLSCSLLADLTAEAGFPPGVFNVVQGIGEEAGAALVGASRSAAVSFTGSSETGRLVGLAAARNLVPFTAELGGKGAVRRLRRRRSRRCRREGGPPVRRLRPELHGGHATSRRGARLRGVPRALSPGGRLGRCSATRGMRPRRSRRSSTVSISRASRASWSARGRTGTASCAAAGRSTLGGLWYEQTLIEPRTNDPRSSSARFRPGADVPDLPDRGRGRGARQLDGVRAGSAILYTSSAERAERVGRALRAGTVWVNSFLVRDLTAPFGGIGISGIGREGGDYALDFYSDLKTLQILDGTTE